MPSSHISLSGGLLTHQFIEAVQQTTFNQPATAPETFDLPGRLAPSPAELERTIGSAWELLVERWDGIERDLMGMDISTLRDRWIRPLFLLLDFFLEYQRADLVLEDDGRPGGGLRFPISHIGLPTGAEHIRVPVHTVLPGNGNSTASSLDTRREAGSGLRRLAPHDLLQRYLNLSRESKWGILSDGLHLRLLRDYHHTYTRGYVEFDLQGIFTGRDFAAFRALYRLCHASRFVPMTTDNRPPTATIPVSRGKSKPVEEDEDEEEPQAEAVEEALTPLESFYQHALSTGVKVGEDLRGRVRDAIETFANGFLQATPGMLSAVSTQQSAVGGLSSSISLHQFYDDILHTIYRILFLLFAEQRGMFPGRGSLYMDEYSLTALRALAERPFGEDHHVDLWERLKSTFRMVEYGAPGLNIFGYNGALFSASKTPILTPIPYPLSPDDERDKGIGDRGEAPILRNDSLLSAIRSLTTVERDNVLQRISYADLSVEEMGSVYESLLDYTPRIATAPETVENRSISAGMFYLDPRGKARKTSGSYYTHPSLVNELIKSALLPVLEDRLKSAVQSYDADHPERLTPEEKTKAEEALLAIKVIDPAAGSGAFLIAADNTLGLRLAQIRTGDLYPAEREVRRARRDVLANCLYAVDLNPMAVELCKVSLWINAVVEDERLNFLDHHIKCGNSLVGAFRRLVAQGIPSEAYGGAAGDDKALVRAARSRNDQERRGQLSAFRVTELKSLADLHAWVDLNRLAQEDPAKAEQRYRELQAQSEESAERLAFDLWTAAFFWPFEEETGGRQADVKAGIQARRGERITPLPPTTQDVFQALAAPGLVDEALKAFTRDLRDEHHFFHWELEFLEVFSADGAGGFNVVLGNPPWEKYTPLEKEFFSFKDSNIASAKTKAERDQFIRNLSITNPYLLLEWNKRLLEAGQIDKFIKKSNCYPLTSPGEINTYRIFAELGSNIVNPTGRFGMILKTGILNSDTCKEFFVQMNSARRIVSAFDITNKRLWFPDVVPNERFCLITISGSQGIHQKTVYASYCLDIDDIYDPQKRYTLSADEIAIFNCNSLTCPTFEKAKDVEILKKMYLYCSPLVNEITGENAWKIKYSTVLHSSGDSELFTHNTYEELIDKGYELHGNIFKKDNDKLLPLYEGKYLNLYNHRFGTFADVPRNKRFGVKAEPKDPTIEQLTNPEYEIIPRYWVREDDFSQVCARKGISSLWFFAVRNVCRALVDARTTQGCIMPGWPSTHSIWILEFENDIIKRETRALRLMATWSSIPFDYVVRQKSVGANFQKGVIYQLAVPSPNVYKKKVTYGGEDVTVGQFVDNFAIELIYTTQSLREFAQGCGCTGSPVTWDEERRAYLRAELDGLYAHLYGLTRDEFAYILDTFPIVRRKDEAKYGEFRTKRMCLEAYDRLAVSGLIPADARALQRESVLEARDKGLRDRGAGEKAAEDSLPQDGAGKSEIRGPQLVDGAPVVDERGQKPGAGGSQTVGEKPRSETSAPKTEGRTTGEKRTASGQVPTANRAEPKAGSQMSFTDYTLYKCEACGKMVMGYDRLNHARDAHKGKEPGWKKVGK